MDISTRRGYLIIRCASILPQQSGTISSALSNAMLGSRAIPFIYAINTKGGAEYVAGIVIASGSKVQGLGLQESRKGRAGICRLGLYYGVANKV